MGSVDIGSQGIQKKDICVHTAGIIIMNNPRRPSQKGISRRMAWLREKCVVCGRRNENHGRPEAIACEAEKKQPWFYSVDPDRMKREMGYSGTRKDE